MWLQSTDVDNVEYFQFIRSASAEHSQRHKKNDTKLNWTLSAPNESSQYKYRNIVSIRATSATKQFQEFWYDVAWQSVIRVSCGRLLQKKWPSFNCNSSIRKCIVQNKTNYFLAKREKKHRKLAHQTSIFRSLNPFHGLCCSTSHYHIEIISMNGVETSWCAQTKCLQNDPWGWNTLSRVLTRLTEVMMASLYTRDRTVLRCLYECN